MSELETQLAEGAGPCPDCAAKARVAPSEQFIYAIGQLDVRFPTVGVEREFQQRERALEAKSTLPAARGKRLREVLSANPHLWSRVCFVLSIGNVPAYIVAPTSQHTLASMLDAVSQAGDRDAFVVLIGRRVGTAGPGQCGGLMAPIVLCDQIYASDVAEWMKELGARVQPALKARKIDPGRFNTVAREFFDQVARSTENIGALDMHRALNYVLVQHPGLALSVAERPQFVLDRVETRALAGTELRRMIAVILTFVDRSTGVPERLFCRVDVSEEWPFLADGPDVSVPALGLTPYVENTLIGANF